MRTTWPNTLRSINCFGWNASFSVSCFLFANASNNYVRVCHGTLCVFPVDVINTHTRWGSHSQGHAMSKARLLPVLLRITRLFYLEIPAPLDMAAMERALHLSVSICLPPSDSIAPSFSTPTPTWSHKNVVAPKKIGFYCGWTCYFVVGRSEGHCCPPDCLVPVLFFLDT